MVGEEGGTRRLFGMRDGNFEDAELRVLPKYVRGRVHKFECFALGFLAAQQSMLTQEDVFFEETARMQRKL